MHNANIGVLGHVDSGKTSLAKALSTMASTAAFDRNPQSQERGITLDLGFSSCIVPPEQLPASWASSPSGGNVSTSSVKDRFPSGLQLTFVDCPGHASLIRTIMGGAQIIDVMLLVIDVTKGIQTQTSECIVVGEMLNKRLVVALNKVDMIAGENDDEKARNLEKAKRGLRKVFQEQTRWPTAVFVPVAAFPTGGGAPIGIPELIQQIVQLVDPEKILTARQVAQPSRFFLSVDHCFAIRGQGTVMTGTVIDGKVSVGDEVELPDYQLKRKVKGIQVFRKPVESAYKGDRIGLCVPQFDAKDMERGICCSPAAPILCLHSGILLVRKVRFHRPAVEQGAKYHMTVGHATVMGSMRFFSQRRRLVLTASGEGAPGSCASTLSDTFDPEAEYLYEEELPDLSAAVFQAPREGSLPGEPVEPQDPDVVYFAVVTLEQPITCLAGSTIMASKLDWSDVVGDHKCRLAVEGKLLCSLSQLSERKDGKGLVLESFHKQMGAPAGAGAAAQQEGEEIWRKLHVIRRRSKVLAVSKLTDGLSCICKSFVQEGTEAQKFVGLRVYYLPPTDPSPPPTAGAPNATAAAPLTTTESPNPATATEEELYDLALSRGIPGVIEGTFGQDGKVKIRFSQKVFSPEVLEVFDPKAKKRRHDEKKEKEKREKKEKKAKKEKEKKEKKDKKEKSRAEATPAEVESSQAVAEVSDEDDDEDDEESTETEGEAPPVVVAAALPTSPPTLVPQDQPEKGEKKKEKKEKDEKAKPAEEKEEADTVKEKAKKEKEDKKEKDKKEKEKDKKEKKEKEKEKEKDKKRDNSDDDEKDASKKKKEKHKKERRDDQEEDLTAAEPKEKEREAEKKVPRPKKEALLGTIVLPLKKFPFAHQSRLAQ